MKIIAADCETDPFKYGRIPKPFIWGAYDGEDYKFFSSTDEFVKWAREQEAVIYAHNGGKFDWVFIIPYIDVETDVRIIGGRIAEIKLGKATLRDSYSIVPVPLAAIQKDNIDYALMEADVRHLHMEEITSYLKTDVRVLWLLVTAFRDEAGKALTIASNAMNSARKLGAKITRTNHRFDQKFRPFYFGGRTQCFQPGSFEDLSVFDIRSSYPNAMCEDHAIGSVYDVHDSLKTIAPDDLGRAFITLRCYSDGAFPLRQENGSLDFPVGFNLFNVTGWEYIVAKKHGLIKNEQILEARTFHDKINFKPYVTKWFEHKERHRPRRTIEEIAQYTIGKIMMNSLVLPPVLIDRGQDKGANGFMEN